MALSYQLADIAEWRDLNPGTTECMCFALLFTGCPRIDATGKHGWQTVAARIWAWETVAGILATNGQRIDPDTVRRYVGMRTNASPMTDAAFRKKLGEVATRQGAETVARAVADMETDQ